MYYQTLTNGFSLFLSEKRNLPMSTVQRQSVGPKVLLFLIGWLQSPVFRTLLGSSKCRCPVSKVTDLIKNSFKGWKLQVKSQRERSSPSFIKIYLYSHSWKTTWPEEFKLSKKKTCASTPQRRPCLCRTTAIPSHLHCWLSVPSKGAFRHYLRLLAVLPKTWNTTRQCFFFLNSRLRTEVKFRFSSFLKRARELNSTPPTHTHTRRIVKMSQDLFTCGNRQSRPGFAGI